MSLLDKAKEKATQFAHTAKEKADDFKDKRKADDLLDDLGRITYRQHTSRGEAGDDATIAELVAQLQVLEADGTTVLTAKGSTDAKAGPEADAPPPPPPAT